MPKDVNIQPGSAFHLPAAQQKNIGNLMNILSKREATDALKGLGEIDRESWVNMNSTVSTLKEIIDLGGASVVVGDIKEHVKTVIEDNIALAIAPLKNEIATITADILGPIMPYLEDAAEWLSEFVSDYKDGTFWGAMVGSIWGDFGALMGGVVGASLEAFFRFIFWDLWWDHWPSMMNEMVKSLKEWWKAMWGGDSFWEDFWGGVGEEVMGWIGF